MADIPTMVFKHNDLYAYKVLNPVTFEKLYSKEGILSTFLFSKILVSVRNIARGIFDLTQ